MHRYAVALWLNSPPWSLWPEYDSHVEAPTPFAAVESLMCLVGVHEVAYASARLLDGSVIYRGFRVRLLPEVECVLTPEEIVVFG